MTTTEDFNGSKYEVVPIAKMFVPDYQRGLAQTWADDIAGNWNNRLFRPLTLSLRAEKLPMAGSYAIVDGHHTKDACEQRGHAKVPAIVYSGLSLEEEAALFSDLNSRRRRPEAYDLWVSDLAAGREWAETLKDIAERFGLVISKGKAGPMHLRAVGALRGLIEQGKGAVVADALDILTSVYPADDPYARGRIERPMIVGLIDFISRSRAAGCFDKAVATKKLQRATFLTLGQKVRITPDGFQSYLNSLIQSGDLIVPALNTGGGQPRIYGRAFSLAILGRDLTNKVYG